MGADLFSGSMVMEGTQSSELVSPEATKLARFQMEAMWTFSISIVLKSIAVHLASKGASDTRLTIAAYCGCVAVALSLFSAYRSYNLLKASKIGLGQWILRNLWALFNAVSLVASFVHRIEVG